MPEGDSLHRAAARLQALVGQRVEAAAPHPRGAATGVAPAVDGRLLERVEAVGKNLLLHFEGGVTVLSHLRMSGRWRVEPRGAYRTGRPWLVLRARGVGGGAVERPGAHARRAAGRPARARHPRRRRQDPRCSSGRFAGPTRTARSASCSSTSTSSPGSGRCGSPRCCGRRASRPGGPQATSPTTSSSRRSRGAGR